MISAIEKEWICPNCEGTKCYLLEVKTLLSDLNKEEKHDNLNILNLQ